MNKLKVIYIGPLRNLSGKREEEINLPEDATMKDILYLLIRKYGEPFQQAVLDSRGQIQPSLRLILGNGHDSTACLDTKLNQWDRITLLQLLQPMEGG